MDNLVIIGTSETADRVFQFVQRYSLFQVIGFAVDRAYKNVDTFCNRPVWTIEELDSHIDRSNDLLFVAVFWDRLNSIRRDLYTRLKSMGYRFASIISPNTFIRTSHIGENCWIMDGVVMQEDSRLGDNVYVADNAFIGHKSTVGNHCFLGVNSLIMGGVTIGNQTFIGVRASIFDTTDIGQKCVIGACTIIKRNVPDFCVCKTPNDTTIVKQYDESVIESKWLARGNIR